MKTIHLLLAEDHALVREGFKRLFALTPDIVVAEEAFNGEHVLQALKKNSFDLIMLDMTMPGISGPELITSIRAKTGTPPILVVSMHNEAQIAKHAISAGANGYITKDNDPEILLAAIRKVAYGGRFIDPAIAEAIAFEGIPTIWERPAHESLSDREQQVFTMLASGTTVNEIAEQLSISNKTVSTHKARLMEKMGLVSMADLVRYAISHKLSK